MTKKPPSSGSATLHLTVTFNHISLRDILESATEVVEKAREQGKPEGFLEIHQAERIDVEELK